MTKAHSEMFTFAEQEEPYHMSLTLEDEILTVAFYDAQHEGTEEQAYTLEEARRMANFLAKIGLLDN